MRWYRTGVIEIFSHMAPHRLRRVRGWACLEIQFPWRRRQDVLRLDPQAVFYPKGLPSP